MLRPTLFLRLCGSVNLVKQIRTELCGSVERQGGVSNFGQTLRGCRPYRQQMGTPITIIDVESDGPDGVLITFSDRTVAGYVVEELLALRPQREVSRGKELPIRVHRSHAARSRRWFKKIPLSAKGAGANNTGNV